MDVPDVLLSGDHKKIDLWRLAEAVKITEERRPDLMALHPEVKEPLLPKQKKRKRASSEKNKEK
jgi:tRNA (guanine37-N1)-methyltransferase